MKTVGIIQARMGSERLPGKVLKRLAGQAMLARVIRRTQRAKNLDEVVVATTESPEDGAIVALSREHGLSFYRGSVEDVLDRYHSAAQRHKADAVARITSDCPLIDPGLIDEAVHTFLEGPWDYVSNTLDPRTFPRGLDVEVISREALQRAWEEDRDPAWREHVTPYIARHPERFRLHAIVNDRDYSSMRWTVDTQEDLEFVRRIYDHFGHDAFEWGDVLRLLDRHPDWLEINRDVQQKSVK